MAIRVPSRGRPPLPTPGESYDRGNEADTRRQVERTILDLDKAINEVRLSKDGAFTLSLRRHQFLLMGAGNG